MTKKITFILMAFSLFSSVAFAEIERAQTLLILEGPKVFSSKVGVNVLDSVLGSERVRLFGDWSEGKKAQLAMFLVKAEPNRSVASAQALELNVISSLGFRLGADFGVEDRFDHIGSGQGVWGGSASGFREVILTLAEGASEVQVLEFLTKNLPPRLIYDQETMKQLEQFGALTYRPLACDFFLKVF